MIETINAQGVFGGVDMFHSLHCLNGLRKVIQGRSDKQYDVLGEDFVRLHVNHCIEQLRQAIMCHGDLTPVTLMPVFNPSKNVLVLVGQTEYSHTCRDWDGLRNELRKRQF
jgi:hypothetical protein